MPFDIAQQSLGLIVLIFAICTLIIGFAGTRLAGIAIKLAEQTGIGNIGWESVAMLTLYGGSIFYLAG